MTITRKKLDYLDAVTYNWNVHNNLDNLFYPFCVGSFEYVYHMLFPIHNVYHNLHKSGDTLCYLYDNWYFSWWVDNEMVFTWSFEIENDLISN